MQIKLNPCHVCGEKPKRENGWSDSMTISTGYMRVKLYSCRCPKCWNNVVRPSRYESDAAWNAANPIISNVEK